MVTTGRRATKKAGKDTVPKRLLEEAHAKNEALEKEVERLKQELARVANREGGSDKKRRRTEASDNARGPELPTEIWTKIAAKIDDEDVLAFACTSKQLREAQQQAGRKLVTWPVYEDEDGEMACKYFTRDWCVWWSRRCNMTETAPEFMNWIIRITAYHGYLDVLKKYWSDIPEYEKKILMDESACAWAATGGQLETLQWLRSQGCLWCNWTCYRAAIHGHLEVLRWARDNGCPWQADEICDMAAQCGHLSVLKYARSQGCPWGTSTTYWAATRGHLEMLQWLRYEGCPWDKEQCREVGEPNIKRWMDELDAL